MSKFAAIFWEIVGGFLVVLSIFVFLIIINRDEPTTWVSTCDADSLLMEPWLDGVLVTCHDSEIGPGGVFAVLWQERCDPARLEIFHRKDKVFVASCNPPPDTPIPTPAEQGGPGPSPTATPWREVLPPTEHFTPLPPRLPDPPHEKPPGRGLLSALGADPF